jgi:hypothetical protein
MPVRDQEKVAIITLNKKEIFRRNITLSKKRKKRGRVIFSGRGANSEVPVAAQMKKLIGTDRW